eukprot:1693040-Pleurochrysis_carterae.AAC.1
MESAGKRRREQGGGRGELPSETGKYQQYRRGSHEGHRGPTVHMGRWELLALGGSRSTGHIGG